MPSVPRYEPVACAGQQWNPMECFVPIKKPRRRKGKRKYFAMSRFEGKTQLRNYSIFAFMTRFYVSVNWLCLPISTCRRADKITMQGRKKS